MAVNFASMLLQPSKTSAWDLSPSGAGNAREQLKLAREQFEWQKKKAEEDNRLEREKQAAEMAKARLAAEATKAAKLQEDRLKVYGEFTKATGEGNVEAARAMVPMMHSLGMGVELEGEEEGLPRYRVDMDAAEAEKQEASRAAQASPYGENETAEQSLSRLGAMGLGGETGSLLPPLGIRSSDEVDPTTGATVADRVAATYGDEPTTWSLADFTANEGETPATTVTTDHGLPGDKTPRLDPATGQPMVDTPDFTGGIPKNVIDMGASAAATLHRLDPALKGMVAAYPDAETRAGAEEIRLGLRGSGLPLGKQMEAFEKGISGPASQRNAIIGADAQAARFRETRDDLTEKDMAGMRETGRRGADELAQRNDIPGGVKALRTVDEIEDLLDNGTKEDDTMIAGALLSIQDVKGIPSDKDLALAFGMDKASAITKVLDYIGTQWQGGFQEPQRRAIKNFIARVKQSQKEKLTSYLDSTDTLSDYNEHEQAGYKGRAKRAVPGYIYNEWLDTRKQRDEGRAGDRGKSSGGGEEFDRALDEQAKAAGYDPNKIRAVIRHESGGGKGDAKSVAGAAGAFQLMGDRAQEVGTSSEELLEMPAAQQVPYGIKYLKNTKLKGDAPTRDYALAFAAPAYIGKSNDTVVTQYKKGTKRGDQVREQNPGWVPKDGGEITVGSILAFYGLDGDKGTAQPTEPAKAAALPEPKTPAEKRYLELLKKRGG